MPYSKGLSKTSVVIIIVLIVVLAVGGMLYATQRWQSTPRAGNDTPSAIAIDTAIKNMSHIITIKTNKGDMWNKHYETALQVLPDLPLVAIFPKKCAHGSSGHRSQISRSKIATSAKLSAT